MAGTSHAPRNPSAGITPVLKGNISDILGGLTPGPPQNNYVAYGGFLSMEVPKNEWFRRANPSKMDDN